jgi:Uma2 family endonuclease
MSPKSQRSPITVDEYYRMAETGVLAPDARVELIDGEIVDIRPIGSPRTAIATQLSALLHGVAAPRGIVQVRQPIRLDQYSEPEPDIALVRWRADWYKSSHPTAADTLLLIEVSESLKVDTNVKVPLYARHRVPEVWFCDLTTSQMHVFRSPAQDHYTETYSVGRSGVIRPAAFDDIAIDLSQLVWP